MSKETFEEWAYNYTNNHTSDTGYTLTGLAKIIARDAWNASEKRQQEKIQDLEAKLEVCNTQRITDFENSVNLDAENLILKEKLAKAVKALKNIQLEFACDDYSNAFEIANKTLEEAEKGV